MKDLIHRLISQLLIVSVAMLPFTAQSALVGTGEAVAGTQSLAARETVQNFFARSDVQKELQAYGLNAEIATERANALTDDELQRLAGKISTLPAGAFSGWEIAGILALVFIFFWILWK